MTWMDRSHYRTCKDWIVMLCLTALSVAGTAFAGNQEHTLRDRNRLVQAVVNDGVDALPALIDALEDERDAVRKTAAHLIVRLGAKAYTGFDAALRSPHVEVRYAVIQGIVDTGLLDRYWAKILLDDAPMIRRYVRLALLQQHPQPEGEALDRLIGELETIYRTETDRRRQVVEVLAAFDTLTSKSHRLLVLATSDEDAGIRQVATQSILEHITPEWDGAADLLKAAREDASEAVRALGLEMQWKLLEVAQVRLPQAGWRFRTDPDDAGRDAGWYAPEFDDSGWRDDVPIEASWQAHMAEVYNGVAWYRRNVDIPEIDVWDRVYVHFEGVDEEGWVWMNGTFVGEHTMGQTGWNIPFFLDVTEAVKVGAENQITVRAKNTTGGAGIWRPVRIRLLNTRILNEPTTGNTK